MTTHTDSHQHEPEHAPVTALPAPPSEPTPTRQQRLVPRWTAITTGVAGLALGATLLGGVAFAQTPTADEATPSSGSGTGTTMAQPAFRGGPGLGLSHHLLSLDTIAETLGLTPVEVQTQLDAGTPLIDIINAQGSSVQVVVDALVAEAQEMLDLAVSEGRLTQEHADERLANLPAELTERIESGTFMQRGGPGHFRGGGHGPDGDCLPGAGSGTDDGETTPAVPVNPDADGDAEDATPTTS